MLDFLKKFVKIYHCRKLAEELLIILVIFYFVKQMYKRLLFFDIEDPKSSAKKPTANEFVGDEGSPPSDPPGNLLTGLGILIIFLSVAIVIVIIAIVVSKMRNDEKARKAKPEVEVEVEVEVVDPYKQAVQFPQEPKPSWPDYLKQSFKQAGKKIMGKEDPPHRTTIPEHLRHQLKHIYVY